MSESHETQVSTTRDPPPFDPSKPSIPISYPLKTLDELESRAYFESFHFPFNKSSVPLKSTASEKRPRILVCHDMQGGYIDDKWIQGGNNENAYAIWHWYLIDIFVYFSHNLVTLPPTCWTNTAHQHGTKVMGTFILEGDSVANKLLATKESAHMYADRLAELAAALGFDGWLLNMEISLDPGQIPNLKEFVSHLTKAMHSSVPGSLVIWYDSVTVSGQLAYQNQLNESNKPFFDICDGLFANYWWKADYPKLSADVAGDRKSDVYMGIDVFGRRTFGGGGWDTNVALDVLKKADVSAAIFAPGWVWETKQKPDFQTAQNRWWSLVEKSWVVSKFYPKALPFYSNFDQGHGYHVSVEGNQVSDASWNNLSSQGIQPFLEFKGDPNPDAIQVLVDFKEASYNGGGNITFKGTLKDNNDFTARIFQGELLLGSLPLYLTYSVKAQGDSLLGLSLQFTSSVNERASVLVASWAENHLSTKFNKVVEPHQVKRHGMAPGWVIHEISIEMKGYTLTEIHALCYKRKLDVKLAPTPTEYSAVLGHITMKTSQQETHFPPSSSWQVKLLHIKWSPASKGSSKILSAEIDWKLKNGSDSRFPRYNLYVKKLTKQATEDPGGRIQGFQDYIGAAYVEAFYVSDLSIPSGTSSLKFIIQVCGVDGSCQKLDKSPSFQLQVPS